MQGNKLYRADGTRIISTDSTDNPKLGAKLLGSGKESLYLDFYFGSSRIYDDDKGKYVVRLDRHRESLKLYLYQTPMNAMERERNKQILELAKRIRFEKGQQLLEDMQGYRIRKSTDINFLDFFQGYIDNYTKKDKRMIELAYHRFCDFLKETQRYRKFRVSIKPKQMSKEMMIAFTDYLQTRGKGDGPKAIFKRFKKVVKYAVDQELFRKNPCDRVTITTDEGRITKDILSQTEIKQLLSTTYRGQNNEIRRAFAMSLYCGLRYCDVKDLTFANIDYSNKRLHFEQNKTKGHSSHSHVEIPLNDSLIRLVGHRSHDAEDNLIFHLPSSTMCLKALRRWTEKAGVEKHITWHCARHSFAVNILTNGANIKTVSSLLGHSSLKYTEIYTRAVDELKQEAINSLPELKL